jgi:hypothetical protein
MKNCSQGCPGIIPGVVWLGLAVTTVSPEKERLLFSFFYFI